MAEYSRELAVRAAAFGYLDAVSNHGERPVTWAHLQGFSFQDQQIHLVSQQGIFKPASLDYPISIRTAPPKPDGVQPYDDEIGADDFIRYRYRGTDPNHRENQLLRATMSDGINLIYLLGVAKGHYMVHGAAIIEDDPADLSFSVALFPIDSMALGGVIDVDIVGRAAHGHYLRTVKARVGQAAFRSVVLSAYREQCTICRLRHTELLDAAHITPDADGGSSVVTNGLALCKIHHAAYDANILGVRPDYVAEVRADILDEVDGPMLRHGLQAVHGSKIVLPRSAAKRPDLDGLEARYTAFREAS